MIAKYGTFRHAYFIFVMISLSFFSFAQAQNSGNKNGGHMLSFSEFKFIDIGKTTKPGNTTINKDILEVLAGGEDVWGRHDEFYFGYKTIKGDFDLSVQILSLSAAHLYTKAGIMARSDLSDSSMHVFYQVFPDNSSRNNNNGGCEFQYRAEKTAEMKAIYPNVKTAGHQFDVAFPNTWIRLKRQGDVFESYFAIDGKNWILYSSFKLKLPGELLVGLAVTSHNANSYATASFGSPRLEN